MPSNPNQTGSPPHGLGRGLGALIPTAGIRTSTAFSQAEAMPDASRGALMVPTADIMPNPRQPRTSTTPEALTELADSIRQHGLIQPVILARTRPTDPVPYQLIAGERRWRAAQLAGLAAVPAIVKDASPQELLELALVENIQRADLNALEEAAAYQALMQDFGLTQEEVAERVGRSRVAVANILRLLRLPDRVKELLVTGVLSEGHARALLGLPDSATLMRAAEQVVARQLTVRETEELVRRLQGSERTAVEEAETVEPPVDPHTRQLENALRGVLGTKVSLQRGRRGGKLVIHFYSDEELQNIYEQIVGKS